MALQLIDLGNQPNDGQGDGARTGGQKINANFTELFETHFSLQGRWTVTRYAPQASHTVAVRVDDRVAGWADDTIKDRWIEGIVLDDTISLPADIDSTDKFFLITDRQK